MSDKDRKSIQSHVLKNKNLSVHIFQCKRVLFYKAMDLTVLTLSKQEHLT